MKKLNTLRWLLPFCLVTISSVATAQSQILATVGDQTVTSDDLDAAIASSPIAVQFPSMDADVQAGLRGDMLKRMVASKLLLLEAKRQGLDKSETYKRDAENYRIGYLYRAYMDNLRDGIKIDEKMLSTWRETYKGKADAMEAARSQEIADRYKLRKAMALEMLKEQKHLKVFEDRLAAGAPADTVLATADGIKLKLGDIQESSDEAYNQAVLSDRLYRQLELMLVVKAAEDDGIRVPMDRYAEDALPSQVLALQEKRWIPDETALRKYYESHLTIGEIPERRHVVQLVVAKRDEAEKYREMAVNGEKTLYQLAAAHSIDPYGRKKAGDMGWLPEGSGMPEIEKAIAKLKDGEYSEVIATKQGFHVVMIEERTPRKQRSFAAVKDRVRQAMINEYYPGYLSELQKRFPVKWGISMVTDDKSAEQLMQQ